MRRVLPKGFKSGFRDRTYVMGILNVTPDSFSEKGIFFDKEKAIAHGLEMARDGADMLDVGGESTRPGAGEVSAEEELRRVIPVIEALAKSVNVPISVDTRKSEVAEEAIRRGAAIVNDVSGLRYDSMMAKVVAEAGAGLVVMHMKGTPRDMQVNPVYKNLIREILDSLKESIRIAVRSGVNEEAIIIDPGIGFGKAVEHNLEVLNRLGEFKTLSRPICVGTSRKSFIGKVLGLEDAKERLAGTLATFAIAIMKGANILRVHDVREALQVSRIADSIMKGRAIVGSHGKTRR